jgi:actin-related protein
MASFYSGDRIDAVVVDIGAASTKIGWAGDDYPRSYFRSVRSFTELHLPFGSSD